MYNHVRTLLLNRSGDRTPGPDYPAEELVPEDFRAVTLPSYLLRLRRLLFGADPDRAMLNYRLRQLLSLVHATELRDYVLAKDPRITYDVVGDETWVRDDRFTPTVLQTAGTAAVLTLVGAPATPDALGRSRFDVRVRVEASDTVEVRRRTPPRDTQSLDFALTDGLSNRLDLIGTGYAFHLDTAEVGAEWQVTGFLRPQRSLGQLAADLEHVGEPVLLELFGVSPAEPYRTFRNLWHRHPELPYRLGGVVLAMAYRTDEVRSGNG